MRIIEREAELRGQDLDAFLHLSMENNPRSLLRETIVALWGSSPPTNWGSSLPSALHVNIASDSDSGNGGSGMTTSALSALPSWRTPRWGILQAVDRVLHRRPSVRTRRLPLALTPVATHRGSAMKMSRAHARGTAGMVGIFL